MIREDLISVAMGAVYETSMPPVQLTTGPFIWAAIFGIGMSLAGAAMPAFKATQLSPLEALRDVLTDEIEGSSRWFVISGVIMTLICGVLFLEWTIRRLHKLA